MPATHKSSMFTKAGLGGFLAGSGCLAYFLFTTLKLHKNPIIHPFSPIYFVSLPQLI